MAQFKLGQKMLLAIDFGTNLFRYKVLWGRILQAQMKGSPVIGWAAMEFGTDVHGTQRIKLYDLVIHRLSSSTTSRSKFSITLRGILKSTI